MAIKLTLYKLKKPSANDLNTQLQFFSQSLGLFSKRDKEKSCFRIFIALIEAKKSRRFLSSDEIADKANLTRATIIHHLKNLEQHGLIRQENNRYSLSNNNFLSIIKSIENQSKELFEELESLAASLDEKLELK